MTILLTDVEGCTALRSRQGDAAAQRALDVHAGIVRTQVAAHDGRLVRGLGEGFLVVFGSPVDAVECARAIQRATAREREADPATALRVRMGLNTGEVVSQGDDLQGVAVTAAARIAERAKGGQILAAEVVRHLTAAHPELGLIPRGALPLRGFPERWRLYEVPWENASAAPADRPARAQPRVPPGAPGPGAGPVLCPVLIGRDEEVRAVESALAAGAEGNGGLVLVLGEAGVGKSGLIREAMGQADQRGWVVLTGRAVPSASPVAFRPVAEALLSALRGTGLPEDPELAPFRPSLGRLVPQWREPGVADTGESIVVVAEGVLRLLRCLSDGGGCLLVLEDLHWADPETLAILEYLADNLWSEQVVCVATLRSEETSAAAALARALRARRAARILDLQRLGPSDVDRMAQACLGRGGVPAAAAEALLTWAEGIPFFVEELLAAWVSGGTLVPAAEGWQVTRSLEVAVPLTFADTVHGRLASLGGEPRAVLEAAALLGRRFDWTLLPLMTGRPEPGVIDALSQAVAAQLLAPDPEGTGFKFRHALTRDAIADALLPPQRAAMSRAALAALRQAHPELPGELCDLAADLALAAGDAAAAADLLLESGRRTVAQGALGSAETILRRARNLPGLAAGKANEIDDALCDALALAGQAEAAATVGADLLGRLAASGAPASARARVHLKLARAALPAVAWDLAERHLAATAELSPPGADAVLDAHLAALAAHVAIGRHDHERAYALAQAAVAQAEAAGLPAQMCEAFEVMGRCLRRTDLAAAAVVMERAKAVADAHRLTVWSIRAAAELGLIDHLARMSNDRIEEAIRLARAAGAVATAAVLELQRGFWLWDVHRLDEALEAMRRSAEAATRLRLDELAAVGALGFALVHAVRGDGPATRERLAFARGVDRTSIRELSAYIRQVAALRADDLPAAEAATAEAMEIVRRTGGLPAPHVGWWVLLRACAGKEHGQARAEVLASAAGQRPDVQGFVAFADAVDAGRAGDRERAAALVDAAMPTLAPTPFFRHLTRRVLAQAAVDDGWGEPVPWLQEALAFFEVEGMDALARTCRSLLARAGDRAMPRAKPSDVPSAELAALGITVRELDVLRLLAEGVSTRGIAEQLYLSPKTVERHIANLAVKAGVPGRSQLVAFAAAWAARQS